MRISPGLPLERTRHPSDRRGCLDGRLVRSAAPLQVVVVDGHTVLRQGIAALLDAAADTTVVGETSTGSEAVSVREQGVIHWTGTGIPVIAAVGAIAWCVLYAVALVRQSRAPVAAI